MFKTEIFFLSYIPINEITTMHVLARVPISKVLGRVPISELTAMSSLDPRLVLTRVTIFEVLAYI